jgi:transcriptional regulator with XRE-family HTH domain
MKRSSIIEERRRHVSIETRRSVDLSFQIVDRIHEILLAKGLKQKDLALMLGKSEAEISRWMRGTHNFTIDTLITIEQALGSPILKVVGKEEPMPA